MIKIKVFHALVSMGNKLFVIEVLNSLNSEVFDSCTRKFTLLRIPYSKSFYMSTVKAVSIGYNIIVFSMQCRRTRVYKYDVINNHWCHIDVEDLKNFFDFNCVKYPTC